MVKSPAPMPRPMRAAQDNNNQNNAQYQQQQQQYQEQLQQHQTAIDQNKADQQKFENRTAAYETLRARYAAERAAYHRGAWPDRYVHWTLDENDARLIGQRVEIVSGDRVGTVTDVAHTPGGRVEALLVQLDSDKVVWIDQADVRYDRADGIVMTNLDRSDLRLMADERVLIRKARQIRLSRRPVLLPGIFTGSPENFCDPTDLYNLAVPAISANERWPHI